ncbi:MAG: ABC transporter ATP-binding protein [Lachnospiraceae bacterium]|nr:ABC transporter ATP-binding protein [Lachnospiraceae bacterium]
MKKIRTHIWEHKGAYFIAVMALVISTSLDMLSPQLTKRIIDDVIGQRNLTILPYLLGGILLVGVGRMIFMYVKEYTFDVTAAKIAGNMRKDIFAHIQGLSAEFFDRNNTGELMARVKDDIDRIWDAIGFVGMLLIEVVIHVSLVLFCMFTLSWKLALIPLVVMAFCGMLAIFLEKKLDKIYEEISEENAKLNTVCEENLGGVRTVKAFAREKHEIQKFLSHNERYFELNMQQSRMFVKYHPYFTLVTKLLPLVMLLCGGYLVLQSEMTLGDLGAFIQYSMNIVWPMEMLGWLTNSFSSAVASNKKIKKIYKETADIKEKAHPTVINDVKGKITFKNVDFERSNSRILKDISFTVEPGKTLGIMGATGSGKSSIIHLLQRLYDCNEGEILMDDVNIKDLSFEQLRGNISVVMQDVFLFSDTIKDNIKLGKADTITDEMVKTASYRAQAGSFIEKLESGYDTVIGERGVGLSGGQKQRISIARALSKGNPILIMDDSTSALDMETEKEIQETLNSLQGTTKIIIGHRVSAVRHADEIIFLKDGEIAERGTHETLLKEKGLYYETYMAQYGAFIQGTEDIT